MQVDNFMEDNEVSPSFLFIDDDRNEQVSRVKCIIQMDLMRHKQAISRPTEAFEDFSYCEVIEEVSKSFLVPKEKIQAPCGIRTEASAIIEYFARTGHDGNGEGEVVEQDDGLSENASTTRRRLET